MLRSGRVMDIPTYRAVSKGLFSGFPSLVLMTPVSGLPSPGPAPPPTNNRILTKLQGAGYHKNHKDITRGCDVQGGYDINLLGCPSDIHRNLNTLALTISSTRVHTGISETLPPPHMYASHTPWRATQPARGKQHKRVIKGVPARWAPPYS